MISVLRFFIFLNAFSFQSSIASVEGELKRMISVFLVPFGHKITNQSQYILGNLHGYKSKEKIKSKRDSMRWLYITHHIFF